jgi:hypothetical protein
LVKGGLLRPLHFTQNSFLLYFLGEQCPRDTSRIVTRKLLSCPPPQYNILAAGTSVLQLYTDTCVKL